MTDRDTHFLGFAALVIREMGMQNLFDPTSRRYDEMQTLLAQCAYDLTYYVLKTAEEHDLFADNFFGRFSLDTEAKLTEIPDLTQWPE